ncbi:MAG: OmpA family protein [Hydrogenothermaceae bacterium]|nr:OmpA family protein [Hydrogenothermaceae bacterium]
MRKLFICGCLISLSFGVSFAGNSVVVDVTELQSKLDRLSQMYGKECSPQEFAYAETYLETLKGGGKTGSKEEYIIESKLKECGPLEIGYVKTCIDSYKVTKKEEKKNIVIRENSVDTISYPVKINYYLSLVEKNIYSDKDGDGIPCYKEIEMGTNPDIADKKEEKNQFVAVGEKKEEKQPVVAETKEEDVNPLNQPVRVHFYFNRADIKKEYLPYLNVVAKFLKMHRDVKVKIVGYTDNIGPKGYNDKLAMKRALSVKKYLTKMGVEPDRVVIEGIGKDRYLVSNDNSVDRFTNRRAEFYVISIAD